MDYANGGALYLAPTIFWALGAEVHTLNTIPDGCNINRDAGSTHIEGLQQFVKNQAVDVGFAFDGDADRCLAVDENGGLVSGDQILYLYGCHLKQQGQLANNSVVTAIMSNFGLYKALEQAGIAYEKTAVGDKCVYENMVPSGHCLGGEGSGHIIIGQYARTGDGILTALMIMDAMLTQDKHLSQMVEGMSVYPQPLINIRVKDKQAVKGDMDVQTAVNSVAEELGSTGRILLRESGTEPVIRVMVGAPSSEQCAALAQRVGAVIRQKGYEHP